MSKTTIFEKHILYKKNALCLNFSRSSRARAGPIWAHTGPYWPVKSPNIHKKIVLIGAFKGPCTLP